MGKKANPKQAVAETLSLFKSAQARDPATVLWVREDENLRRLAMVWPKVTISPADCTSRVPNRLSERWTWLWQHYTFSVKECCLLAGISNYSYGVQLIKRMISLRLIFPDNSRAQWLDQFLTLSAVHLTATLAPNRPSPRPTEPPRESSSPPELED